jgi:hypothetical protein
VPSKELEEAVTETDAGHDFECPECGYASRQHLTKKAALEAGQKHFDEHRANGI